MPDYGSMKDKTPGEDFNQEESYVTQSEFVSSDNESAKLYGSIEGAIKMLRIKKKVKMERLTLNNLGVCYSPTKTNLNKIVFLDADCQ